MIKKIVNSSKLEKVNLVGEKSPPVVILVQEALSLAQKKGLDLIQLNNDAIPKCKIGDYGKLLYKKKMDQRKTKKSLGTKQLRFTLNMGKNDYEVRKKKAISLITQGHFVLCTMPLRGRQITFYDKAIDILSTLAKDVEDIANIHKPVALSSNKKEVSLIIKKK